MVLAKREGIGIRALTVQSSNNDRNSVFSYIQFKYEHEFLNLKAFDNLA